MDLNSKEQQKIHILTAESGVTHTNNFHGYYEIVSLYKDFSEKISIGQDFKCRFCGETNRSQFKKNNAHTFPEFTGNKWLFSKDECKNCNKDFSEYENELANHGLLMRTLYGIKTKNKTATKFKNNTFSLQREESGYKMNLFVINKEKKKSNRDGEIVLDFDFLKDKRKAKIEIPEKEYIPLYVFKALNKIAFSIMPEVEFENNQFEIFKSWLKDKNQSFTDSRLEPYFYIYHNKLSFRQRSPLLILFKKYLKFEKINIPAYSFLFSYGNHIFQIFLPYCSKDNWLLDEKELKLLIIPELLIKKDNKGSFIWMNGFSNQKQKHKSSEFTINLD
jgi:hypothetical protein